MGKLSEKELNLSRHLWKGPVFGRGVLVSSSLQSFSHSQVGRVRLSPCELNRGTLL